MSILMLILIYIAVVSNGMKHSLLGVAWPVMYTEFNVDVLNIGVLTFLINAITILSGLVSGKINQKFGIKRIVPLGMLVTGIAILGMGLAPSYAVLMACVCVLGFAMGIVEPALNNHVAVNYKPMHLSWLQCCWSIGAMIGPMIMSLFLANQNQWRGGYYVMAAALGVIVVLLVIFRSLWQPRGGALQAEVVQEENEKSVGNWSALKIAGVLITVIGAFLLGGFDNTAQQMTASFLVKIKGFTEANASLCMSLFYAGEMVSRFLIGLLTLKFEIRTLMRYSQLIMLAGVVLLFLPLPEIFTIISLFIIGFGFAPVYPLMVVSVPRTFGVKASPTIVGLIYSISAIGCMVAGPIFTFIAGLFDLGVFPYFLAIFGVTMYLSTEISARRAKK